MIRVLIADDHHLVRQGIRALLEKYPHIEVVGDAQDGNEALALTSQLRPDVLLLDINMPQIQGIEVLRDISALEMSTAVVILTMYSDESLIKRAFQYGAWGYLLKNSIAEDLINAIECAFQHKYYISPSARLLFDPEAWKNQTAKTDLTSPVNTLTRRERQVCQLVTQGLTNQAIANELGISVKTVEKHRSNLMDKLGVQDLAGLIREAIRQGIILLDQ